MLAAIVASLAVLAAPPSLDALRPLLWVGEGGGKPGEGTGSFSFAASLDGRVVVRNNRSDYPAAEGKLATTHADRMVVFAEGGTLRAQYWDSEGHVIRYVTVEPGGKVFVFLSDAAPGQPRFHLRYDLVDASHCTIAFEIAPPGKADAFSPCLAAKARRKG